MDVPDRNAENRFETARLLRRALDVAASAQAEIARARLRRRVVQRRCEVRLLACAAAVIVSWTWKQGHNFLAELNPPPPIVTTLRLDTNLSPSPVPIDTQNSLKEK
jgi:hypothetical protein